MLQVLAQRQREEEAQHAASSLHQKGGADTAPPSGDTA